METPSHMRNEQAIAPIPSVPRRTAPKRIRRKAMTTETWARFKNRLALKIKEVSDEFDPSPSELASALHDLQVTVELFLSTTKRKRS